METTESQSPKVPAAQVLPESPARRFFEGSALKRTVRFFIFVGSLCLLFIEPLVALWKHSMKEEMSSHIVLIPVMCAYLVWMRRPEIPSQWAPAFKTAVFGFLAGIGLFVLSMMLARNGWRPPENDRLALSMAAFYLFMVGGVALFCGKFVLRSLAFPLGMLVFIIPLPTFLLNWMEIFLQHASAEASNLLFMVTGMPVFREGLEFSLPGLTLRVAQECSGVRSSLVLLITSLLAANLYLRTGWKRLALVFFTIPLGIVRNAFRIVSLALLSVHVDMGIMDSALHHRGGPIFFGLSLIPFFLLLIFLRRSDYPTKANAKKEG